MSVYEVIVATVGPAMRSSSTMGAEVLPTSALRSRCSPPATAERETSPPDPGWTVCCDIVARVDDRLVFRGRMLGERLQPRRQVRGCVEVHRHGRVLDRYILRINLDQLVESRSVPPRRRPEHSLHPLSRQGDRVPVLSAM